MEQPYQLLEGKMESLTSVVVDLSKTLLDAIKKTDENFGILEKRLETIECKMQVIENKIDHLDQSSSSEFRTVGGKIDHLHEEVQKIQKISNYSEQYENLLKISR